MSAFALYVGARVKFEGKTHVVEDVILAGPTAPYGKLRCEGHNPDYCPASRSKISWHSLEWAEPQAREDQVPRRSVTILLRGRDVRESQR